MKKQELTQELLKELLFYDPDTGVFTWRERDIKWFKNSHFCNAWNTRYANKEAGGIYDSNIQKYMQISIFKKRYRGNNLAYFYMTGNWPKEEIDCIDGDYTNLKYTNMRECTRSDRRIKQILSVGETKLIGASLHSDRKKFVAQIKINGNHTYIGAFETPEEAHEAYVNAKRQISPEFTML